jgi:hypothetical protein
MQAKSKREQAMTARAVAFIAASLGDGEQVAAVLFQARKRPYLALVSPIAAALAGHDASFVATNRHLFLIRLTFLRGRPGRVVRVAPLGSGCGAVWRPDDKVWQKLALTMDGKEYAYRVPRSSAAKLPAFVAAVNR